jgi:hypothetical protein
LGWAEDGRAIVYVWSIEAAACGSGMDEPGVYLIDPYGAPPELLFPTRGGAVMWTSL